MSTKSNNIISPELLNGEFIRLRLLSAEDASEVVKWRNSPKAKYLNKGSVTVEEQIEWIKSRPDNELNFIITDHDKKRLGMVSLVNINMINKTAEPGRLLMGETDDIKGTPAVYEALLLVHDYAFDKLGIKRVYGTIAEENTEMIKFQKFLGMKEEGRLRRHYFINGKFQDAICFGLLEEEYRSVYRRKLINMIALFSKS